MCDLIQLLHDTLDEACRSSATFAGEAERAAGEASFPTNSVITTSDRHPIIPSDRHPIITSDSHPPPSGRLWCTVSNILSLYCHVTPVAHAHALKTMPLVGAPDRLVKTI